MFSHSGSEEATEDVYLKGLDQVRQYYRKHGIRIKIIRINVLEQLNAHMETDDNDNEARI